jgi:CheY-like chemotaxis protein
MTRSAALRSQGSAKADAGAPKAGTKAPPGSSTARSKVAPPEEGAGPPGGQKTPAKDEEATLELVLREVRAIRETQQGVVEMLDALLRGSGRPATPGAPGPAAEEPGPALAAIRAHRRRTVLLVDDDPQTRGAAVEELLRADVPVRTCEEGRAALASIAQDKPDVIALELGIGGDMGGKDLVNMIKATMEWVDIPIILWTREAVATQKEARQIHGADEVVPKSGGPAALVARVITLFRRG